MSPYPLCLKVRYLCHRARVLGSPVIRLLSKCGVMTLEPSVVQGYSVNRYLFFKKVFYIIRNSVFKLTLAAYSADTVSEQ